MEPSEVVGVQTRARKLSLATAPASAAAAAKRRKVEREQLEPDYRSSRVKNPHGQHRRRRIDVNSRQANPSASCVVSELHRFSRGARDGVAEIKRSGKRQSSEKSGDAGESESGMEVIGRRETTPANEVGMELGDLESNIRRNSGRSADLCLLTPPAYEVEAFFAEAEAKEHRLFAEKYNYDVVNDVPLDGRFEWLPLVK